MVDVDDIIDSLWEFKDKYDSSYASCYPEEMRIIEEALKRYYYDEY